MGRKARIKYPHIFAINTGDFGVDIFLQYAIMYIQWLWIYLVGCLSYEFSTGEVVEMLVAVLDWKEEYPDDELCFLSLRKRLVMLLHECDT